MPDQHRAPNPTKLRWHMGPQKRPAAAVTKKAMKSARASMKVVKVRPGKRGLKAADRKVMDSNDFELEEDDNFVAPIFKDDDYKGTGAFKLVEWYDGGKGEEAFGSVQVMGASSPKLMRSLEERFEESDGLVHFCKSDHCKYESIGLKLTHLHAFEYITQKKLEQLSDDDFIALNHRY